MFRKRGLDILMSYTHRNYIDFSDKVIRLIWQKVRQHGSLGERRRRYWTTSLLLLVTCKLILIREIQFIQALPIGSEIPILLLGYLLKVS